MIKVTISSSESSGCTHYNNSLLNIKYYIEGVIANFCLIPKKLEWNGNSCKVGSHHITLEEVDDNLLILMYENLDEYLEKRSRCKCILNEDKDRLIIQCLDSVVTIIKKGNHYSIEGEPSNDMLDAMEDYPQYCKNNEGEGQHVLLMHLLYSTRVHIDNLKTLQ